MTKILQAAPPKAGKGSIFEPALFFYFPIAPAASTFSHMKKSILIALLLLMLCPTAGFSQVLTDEFPRAQSLFARAQRLMREKDYPGAIDAYAELVRGFRNSEYRDIYEYGLARAFYHLGDFSEAERQISTFPSVHPNSYLLPYAYQLLANCQYRRGQLELSFRNYINAYRRAGDERLRNLSRRAIIASVEAGYFPADSVVSAVPDDISCDVKARMMFLMKDTWGKQKIDSFMTGCSQQIIKEDNTPKPSQGGLAIGAMLPLSGPYAKYGQYILDGMLLAADELKKRHIPLEILAYDTKADNVTAARQAIVLADGGVDMIIGPLLSNVAATTAAALSGKNIPQLVPAASQAGFTDLSKNCFQMTPSMNTIGRGMAQYAVLHRGMTTLAVISPTSVDELTMAESFIAEAEKLGARVLAFERFRPGETDFGPYIKDIKEAIMGPIDDSTFFVTLEGDTLRPGEVAVTFDGMFIPATEQQLFLLLPQLQFFRINTSFLGTSEWQEPKVRKLGESVLRDAVFYSSRAAMTHSLKYDEFSSAHNLKYGSEPDRLAALGYDAVYMAADAFEQGGTGPGDINEYIRGMDHFERAAGKITFGANRSNIELPLFTYKEDTIAPLERRVIVTIEEDGPPPDSVGTQYIKYEY